MSDALAEVLGAMTEREASWWRSWLASPHLCGRVSIGDGGASFCVRPDWRRAGVTYELRWTHPTPAEAVEALHARGLWPWPPGDHGVPAWWCERCAGSGTDPEPSRMVLDCMACLPAGATYRRGPYSQGHTTAPPSHVALVSVARLSAETLRAIEEIARVIAQHAGCVGARVVWRVMSREALREHHVRICSDQAWRGGSPTLPEVVSVEEAIRIDGGAWPWHAAEDWSDSTARAAWPALRDLAALGVHLIAIDERRVVLAVEEIGGGRE